MKRIIFIFFAFIVLTSTNENVFGQRYVRKLSKSTFHIKIVSDNKDIGAKILPEIKNYLTSEYNLKFTGNVSYSDYIITLKTKLRKGDNTDGLFFSYVDLVIVAENNKWVELYTTRITDIKGDGLSYEQALDNALSYLHPSLKKKNIYEIMLQNIFSNRKKQ